MRPSVSVRACVCVYERAWLPERRAELEKRGAAKYSETVFQRLLLLGLIPSRVSCKDLEL